MKMKCECGCEFEYTRAEVNGGHALLCGDSTKAEDVARLMDGEQAHMCLTDPPYAVDYSISFSKAEGGADPGNQRHYHESDEPAFNFLKHVPDVIIMTFPIDRHFQALAAALCEYEFDSVRECIWVKNKATFHPGASFRQQHEPILLLRRSGAHLPSGQRSTIIECENASAHADHPTEKPMELWANLMDWYDGIVYDPFVGSGTTIIAAEQLGRRCYAMEIECSYVDVALERWANLTGADPVLERTGDTFNQLKAACDAKA